MRNRKRRLQHRLRRRQWQEHKQRLFQDQNIHYDYAEKTRAGRFGGLGVCRLLLQRLGLADALDDNLHLLKRHLPYHESDHILHLSYNILAGGTTLADLDLLRNDDTYLDALGVATVPDPTTRLLSWSSPGRIKVRLNRCPIRVDQNHVSQGVQEYGLAVGAGVPPQPGYLEAACGRQAAGVEEAPHQSP